MWFEDNHPTHFLVNRGALTLALARHKNAGTLCGVLSGKHVRLMELFHVEIIELVCYLEQWCFWIQSVVLVVAWIEEASQMSFAYPSARAMDRDKDHSCRSA